MNVEQALALAECAAVLERASKIIAQTDGAGGPDLLIDRQDWEAFVQDTAQALERARDCGISPRIGISKAEEAYDRRKEMEADGEPEYVEDPGF